MRSVWINELTWEDVEEYLARDKIVLIPVGSTEQHGPAGPLGVDAYAAIAIAEDAAKEADVLTTPPLWFSDAPHHLNFPGTISLKPETLINVIKDIVYEAIHANHRILIFSQFTSMLDILDESLKHYDIAHFKLTGATPSHERAELVDKFNENQDIKVFLISLKAGGTGLNLVGADTVIHYDPWWNLSAENQASDRVHRIGQKNNVQIIKMITKDSIEEKILNLQLQKKELFEKVVSEESSILSKLTNEELLSLFNIELKK